MNSGVAPVAQHLEVKDTLLKFIRLVLVTPFAWGIGIVEPAAALVGEMVDFRLCRFQTGAAGRAPMICHFNQVPADVFVLVDSPEVQFRV